MKTKAEQDEHLRKKYKQFKEERKKQAQAKKEALGLVNTQQGTQPV
jgi:hypothetical protein